ncbi:hypothetical protein OAF98_05800 [Planctomicrobium sp.]|jgi:hypothetical protein|nr:hypothetical protein [Planctomicrobium sp.]MDB4743982.1 hypothetical protein [Planctomicrobium sp.]
MSDAPVSEEPAMSESNQPVSDKGVILISYPKIVFMWPSWFVSIFCAFYMWFNPAMVDSPGGVNACLAFLIVFSLNLIVLSFDFPRTTSFLLFAVITSLVLVGVLIFSNMPNILPAVSGWLAGINPIANATFYVLYAIVMTFIYIFVYIMARFDYWEVRPNELLHHHGVLSDLERFSAPHLRIDKEINDIFEYLLLRSGRLILQPSGEKRAIILDNVFFISSKEKRITKLLGALQVQVRDGD